jgi:hypothetical protein
LGCYQVRRRGQLTPRPPLASRQRIAPAILPAPATHVIDRILAGRLRTWTDTGNAHTLTLTRRGATLESTADDAAKPEKLALEDLREALSAWLALLQQGRRRGAD